MAGINRKASFTICFRVDISFIQTEGNENVYNQTSALISGIIQAISNLCLIS